MNFLTAIAKALQDFFNSLLGLVTSIFLSLWTILTDIFLWVFDQLMSLMVSIVSALDLAAITSNAAVFGEIPAEVLNVLGLCGIGECLVVLAAAITIRILLQLIPFTRLGS